MLMDTYWYFGGFIGNYGLLLVLIYILWNYGFLWTIMVIYENLFMVWLTISLRVTLAVWLTIVLKLGLTVWLTAWLTVWLCQTIIVWLFFALQNTYKTTLRQANQTWMKLPPSQADSWVQSGQNTVITGRHSRRLWSSETSECVSDLHDPDCGSSGLNRHWRFTTSGGESPRSGQVGGTEFST